MSDIKNMSVTDRLNLRNTWATLEDMKRYCEYMAEMMNEFILEVESIQDKNEELKEELEDVKDENIGLKQELKELKSELEIVS